MKQLPPDSGCVKAVIYSKSLCSFCVKVKHIEMVTKMVNNIVQGTEMLTVDGWRLKENGGAPSAG